jgi:hypothetical protein
MFCVSFEDESNTDIPDAVNQGECSDSSSELFNPSIAKFPKKMTELLLFGKTPQTTKSVDEFMDEIPILGKKKRSGGRRRMNELSKENKMIMGRINMLYVKKDFDAAWSLCEELIQKGIKPLLSFNFDKCIDLNKEACVARFTPLVQSSSIHMGKN